MAKLFGVDIAKALNRAAGSGLLALTVERTTHGDRTASDPTGGKAERSSSSTGRGFVEDYTDREIDGKDVQRGDRKVSILGASLTPSIVPRPGDVITIEGESVAIVEGGVKTDPAKALYLCQARAF